MKLFNGYKTIVPKFHDIYLLIDDHFYCKQLKSDLKALRKSSFFNHSLALTPPSGACARDGSDLTHVFEIGKQFQAISIDGGNTLILNFN